MYDHYMWELVVWYCVIFIYFFINLCRIFDEKHVFERKVQFRCMGTDKVVEASSTAWLCRYKSVDMCESKVLGHPVLSFLFIFPIRQTAHEAPQEEEKLHFLCTDHTDPHILISTLSSFLLPTFSPLSFSSSWSFMYRSEEPATYHRSLERLSIKAGVTCLI